MRMDHLEASLPNPMVHMQEVESFRHRCRGRRGSSWCTPHPRVNRPTNRTSGFQTSQNLPTIHNLKDVY